MVAIFQQDESRRMEYTDLHSHQKRSRNVKNSHIFCLICVWFLRSNCILKTSASKTICSFRNMEWSLLNLTTALQKNVITLLYCHYIGTTCSKGCLTKLLSNFPTDLLYEFRCFFPFLHIVSFLCFFGFASGPCGAELPEVSKGSSGCWDGQPVHHLSAVLHLHSGWRPGDEEQTHHLTGPEVHHRGYDHLEKKK